MTSRDGSQELYPGVALPHFNEVDEGVAVDSLVTNRIWTAMGLDPATTLHDIRWGSSTASTSSGSSRSPVRCPRRTTAATTGHTACVSRRCTSRSAAARSAACRSRGRSSGRACS
ncbi:hypothetical protein V2I01_25345 [Micromonospora sp. BRA006-A]|nr:hypothetical protein [Micromonospora sp. BRA006-A]